MKHLQRHLLVLLLALLPGVASFAGEAADSLYIFRFVQGKDAFYAPWRDNSAQLEALLTLLRAHREAILSGSIPVRVDGYCTGQAPDEENRRMAAVRSNRVKSELIGRAGVTEACFVTANHAVEYAEGVRNVVTVKLCIPADINETKEDLPDAADTDLKIVQQEQRAVQQEQKAVQQEQKAVQQEQKAIQQAQKSARQAKSEAATPEQPTPTRRKERSLSLRTNLLYDAFLLPTLGVEWRICPSWGIAVNGSWTSWSWSDKDRRYALWEVAPEVRYYMGEKKAWHLGAMFKAGQFNYKLSETGKQGDLMGGGITAGYQLRLNKALALDFNLGLGYLNADFEKYEVIDGVRVRRGNETKDWWGPINAGVTLVWKLF